MRIRTLALRFAAFASLLIVIALAQHRIEAQKSLVENQELLYFPNEKLLRHFTAGMSNIVADVMWLRTISYMSQEFDVKRRKYEWLEHMGNTVTNIDPYFEDVYAHGGMFLAAVSEDEKALRFMKKGLVANPYSSKIPEEIARTYVLNRREDPVTPFILPHYLRLAAERQENPQRYAEWALHIQQTNDISQESREMWYDAMTSADSEMVREMAAKNYYILTAMEVTEFLRKAAKTFEDKHGRTITSLDELVESGILSELPSDSNEGTYFVDSTGSIQNTLLSDDSKERALLALRSLIGRFLQDENRYPSDLDELSRVLNLELPEHPYEDQEWRYDSQTGDVY